MTHRTSIDVAPPRAAFATGAIEAVPGHACVFAMRLADGLHDAALRASDVSAD